MLVAVAQYPSAPEGDELRAALDAVQRAADRGASVVVLPEAAPAPVLGGGAGEALGRAASGALGVGAGGEPGGAARGRPGWSVVPEPLDGPFVTALRTRASELRVTVVAGMWERVGEAGTVGTASTDSPPSPAGTAGTASTVVVVGADGALRAAYRKLHLYDAFGFRESDHLVAGAGAPPVLVVGDDAGESIRLGLMTCYDLRFPEVARDLAVRGAELVAVPAAWVAGPGKRDHWELLLRARALENTTYVAAAARTPPGHVGHAMVVDPLGSVLVDLGAGDVPGGSDGGARPVAVAVIDAARVAEARRTLPVLTQRRYSDPVLEPGGTPAPPPRRPGDRTR